MKKTSVYIAGPMRGLPELNYPAFHEAAEELRQLGFKVWNPAEICPETDWTTQEYMAVDLPKVLQSELVFVLPGWEKSVGARLECHVAEVCGISLFDYPSLLPMTPSARLADAALADFAVEEAHAEETICQEADRLVSVDRQNYYGHPLDDFSKTAAMWSVIFGVEVAPEQVPLAMIAVKVSRELNRTKRDNLVDIAGYAKTIALIHEERARRIA